MARLSTLASSAVLVLAMATGAVASPWPLNGALDSANSPTTTGAAHHYVDLAAQACYEVLAVGGSNNEWLNHHQGELRHYSSGPCPAAYARAQTFGLPDFDGGVITITKGRNAVGAPAGISPVIAVIHKVTGESCNLVMALAGGLGWMSAHQEQWKSYVFGFCPLEYSNLQNYDLPAPLVIEASLTRW